MLVAHNLLLDLLDQLVSTDFHLYLLECNLEHKELQYLPLVHPV